MFSCRSSHMSWQFPDLPIHLFKLNRYRECANTPILFVYALSELLSSSHLRIATFSYTRRSCTKPIHNNLQIAKQFYRLQISTEQATRISALPWLYTLLRLTSVCLALSWDSSVNISIINTHFQKLSSLIRRAEEKQCVA